jgi:BON domain
MNRLMLKRIFPQFIALFAVVVLCAGVAAAQNQNPAPDSSSAQATTGQRTDGQIEMDVVHALDASQALKDDLITAATIQGEVTLSGTVSKQASKDLAASIVKGVPGVTKVNNNLTVGDVQAAAQAQNLPPDQSDDTTQPQAPPQNEPMPMPDNGQAAGQAGEQPAPAPGEAPNQPPAQGQNQYPPQGQYPPPQYPAQPYPSQPQYPAQPYPPARPQYAPPPQQGYGQQPPYGYPQPPAYQPARGPVTVPQGTLIQLRTSEPVDGKRAKAGTPVQFTVIQDVPVGGVLAIPRGATVHGVITEVKKAGELTGSNELALTLTSLDLGGQSYQIQSDEFRVKGPGKGNETARNTIGGALLGTIIGCAAGRGVGCAVGAGAGAAAGAGATAASSGPRAWIPAEALVTFHLYAPVTVNPVSAQEAARLAEGLYPGGPNLYRRGYAPYGYYAPNGYPAYAYPPVYYVPYYMVGGAYYWR